MAWEATCKYIKIKNYPLTESAASTASTANNTLLNTLQTKNNSFTANMQFSNVLSLVFATIVAAQDVVSAG